MSIGLWLKVVVLTEEEVHVELRECIGRDLGDSRSDRKDLKYLRTIR